MTSCHTPEDVLNATDVVYIMEHWAPLLGVKD